MDLRQLLIGPVIDLMLDFIVDNMPAWKTQFVEYVEAKVTESPNEYDDHLVPLLKAILGV